MGVPTQHDDDDDRDAFKARLHETAVIRPPKHEHGDYGAKIPRRSDGVIVLRMGTAGLRLPDGDLTGPGNVTKPLIAGRVAEDEVKRLRAAKRALLQSPPTSQRDRADQALDLQADIEKTVDDHIASFDQYAKELRHAVAGVDRTLKAPVATSLPAEQAQAIVASFKDLSKEDRKAALARLAQADDFAEREAILGDPFVRELVGDGWKDIQVEVAAIKRPGLQGYGRLLEAALREVEWNRARLMEERVALLKSCDAGATKEAMQTAKHYRDQRAREREEIRVAMGFPATATG